MLRAVLWVGIAVASLWGQTLQLRRSDGGDTSFVTAGERFRVRLQLRQATVFGAGCQLRYSPVPALQFAGWKAGDFPAAETVVIARTDTGTGEGVLEIAALSLSQQRREPTLVELEFVVLPQAAHGALASLRATQGWSLLGDSLRSLPLATATFAIHGYIEVWPGDANNDGVVDSRDVALVGLYAYRGATGYRRMPASTEWAPQTALAWADPQATYADCDGNGVVSVRDLAVVLQNYGFSRGSSLHGRGEVAGVLSSGQFQVLARYALPPEAELVAGVVAPCSRGTAVEVQLSGVEEPGVVVASLDSLVVFVARVAGAAVLELLGEGRLCHQRLEYRTKAGEWHVLEALPVAAQEEGAAGLEVEVQQGYLCLVGQRASGGWLELYSLLGQRMGTWAVPAGEGQWCVALPFTVRTPVLVVSRGWRRELRSRWLIP